MPGSVPPSSSRWSSCQNSATEEVERQLAAPGLGAAQRHQRLVLVEQQVGAVERERLLDVDQELARQPLEVALVQELAAELREIPALAELGAVLQPFERGADPLARRHQQPADRRTPRPPTAGRAAVPRDAGTPYSTSMRRNEKPARPKRMVRP